MRVTDATGSLAWAATLTLIAATLAGIASCATGPVNAGFVGDAGDTDEPTPTFGDDGSAPPGPCVKLQCQRVDCGGAPKTSLHGIVVTGAKVSPDPVFNAIVYIPNEDVQPFPDGVMCDRCGVITSGKPVSAAVTAADGSFTLNDVPVGTDIPLVVQLGKWRRQVVIPAITACQVNELTQEQTRFPRNHTEGDMPQIAIATGFIDPLECVLRKMGIDDSEFTPPSGGGRVHMYDSDGARVGTGTPSAEELWTDIATLKQYDMVILPCEGSAVLKTPAQTQNMIDYASLGGRVMTSHYGYVWIAEAQMPFPSTADWNTDQGPLDSPLLAVVDRGFPKGQAMADWLRDVGASDAYGTISIDEPRHDLGIPRNGSRRWVFAADDPTTVLHMTFNTPVGISPDQQCGRVVYSDFHVTPSETVAADPFPSECRDGALESTERVLEFMLLDLDTCIQDDNEYPKPPSTR